MSASPSNGRYESMESPPSRRSRTSGSGSSLTDRLLLRRGTTRAKTVASLLAIVNDEMAYECDAEGETPTSEPSVVLQGGQRRMTPCQEYWNAFSMVWVVLPCFFFLYLRPDASVNVWIVSAAQLIHMPASMLYHIQMGRYQKEVHPIDNPWRVGDQFFIMVGAAGWAFALSGVLWYGTIVSAMVVLYCYWLCVDYWNVSHGRPGDPLRGGAPGRRHSIGILVVLQLAPIVAHRQLLWGGLAALFFFLAASVFLTYPCGGYSHTVFHLGLVPFTWCILEAANQRSGFEIFPSTSEPRAVVANYVLAVVLVLCIIMRHCLCCRREEES